jgi:tetratricopeptide (TPR) repeat protein
MRKNLYPILIAFTGVLFMLIVLFSKKSEAKLPTYKERTGVLAQSPEWLSIRQQMQSLIAAIETNPKDFKSKLMLALAYVEESRITGDHAHYDQAALTLLDDVIANEPTNVDALCGKATVLLSQHHFSDALVVAKEAEKLVNTKASVYGLLCDANVELGNYEEAVKMADKMVSLRPDIRSYSRVSYLREIYGDYPGAIQVMKLAVSSGYPGMEQTEWARMILAHLYESTGQLDSAQLQYGIALAERASYPYALAGLGKIEKARGNFGEAIKYYEQASSIMSEFSFTDELTDLYRLTKQNERAKKTAAAVITMLSPMGAVDEEIEGHGHYADKELAYAFIKTGQYDSALVHAEIEYARRPKNIDVCETMAWVNYKKGNFKAADTHITQALRTNCANPILLARAGLIKIRNGQKDAGVLLIQRALKQNPFLDVDLKTEIAPYAIAS